jgi:hypothetical protein
LIRRVLLIGGVALVVIQLIPYGRDHENPPAASQPAWDSPETRALVEGACFDCHSHETRWPWYSHIAPFSWLIQRDVMEGRAELNFSTSDDESELDDLAESIRDGRMPPDRYRLLYPTARLTEAEKDELLAGLEKTFGSELGSEEDEDETDDEDD